MADSDSNGVTHKYIYGKGLLAIVTSSARYCYHFNGTGSTVALTDVNQNVVNSYADDPFGQILGQQETIPQPFKCVGQYGVMAEPNGLYYMRARYYDPTVGRFISEDPLGFGGGDVNLFSYVHNNPVNRIDPFGLDDLNLLPPGSPEWADVNLVTSPPVTFTVASHANPNWFSYPNGETALPGKAGGHDQTESQLQAWNDCQA